MITPITEIKDRLEDALQSLEDARDESRDIDMDIESLTKRQGHLELTLDDIASEIRNLTAELEEHDER
jgi:chromosome segregation ATPase